MAVNEAANHKARQRVVGLYDWLSRFNLLMNYWKFGRSGADLTMHKTLRVPADAAQTYVGEQSRLYIVDRALEAAHLDAAPQVLDAGCGFGGTMFRWQEKIGGEYDGLTLSPVQLRHARQAARRKGLANVCRFHLQSYDDPMTQRFDAVVSIEALVHSPDFTHSLGHLASTLAPGGKLVMVEDIPKDEALQDPDFELMRQHWGLFKVPTESTYSEALAQHGLRLVHDTEYSEGFETMPPHRLAQLEKRYSRIHSLAPFAGVRFIAGAFLGGVALERLYQKNLVRYRLLVAQRVK